ncbi:docking protein 2 isoform X2 [Anoplopoma fimbria]|uniref:docking protein 2 isoform X2 n=1 Tax=Anoplopoma fimbria TaxID=229290 RepID=UPI0023EB4AAC|nr:docking protein 2 isoform X2 [Anoplopoma fimbria]
MEEDIRKQGVLHLQQQRFGKVIRLSDCIRVSEVEMDGCPRDTGPFLIETTDKIYVFAADRLQLDNWTHKLCEIAFPMNWTDPGVKRGSLSRGRAADEDAGMEDNSLYSCRETVRDFRVCVRRTEASDRCRMKGDGFLRADVDALHLLEKNGDVVFSWPYKYLRRFGRDKSTFSFEAGRRCDSGEGSFEFDTKQGNFVFQAVEAAINRQRISFPQRQTSSGAQTSPETPQDKNLPPLPLNPPLVQSRTLPLPQLRGHIPQSPAAQAADGVYSLVTQSPNLQMIHLKDKESSCPSQQQQQQQRLQLSRLEPPVDKMLTGVKSLTLDTRGVPRKNQVKMISSCPLPHAGPEAQSPKPSSSPNPDQTYSQVILPTAAERGTKRGGGMPSPSTSPVAPQEPEYSLPFDTISVTFMTDILNSHQAHGAQSRVESGADPLYDSIDEMKIRNIFLNADADVAPADRKVEHIYDEPEGCAAPGPKPPTSLYDDPEEMKGDAWRSMGTVADPKGHEYPYNPRVDDYAVPKRAQRVLPATQSTNEEEEDVDVESQEEDQEERWDPPYNNVIVKMA